MEAGKVNDYPAAVTNQISDTNQAIFGKFDALSLLIWGHGVSVLFDPFSRADQAETKVTMHLWCNTLIQYPGAFCVSADAANQ